MMLRRRRPRLRSRTPLAFAALALSAVAPITALRAELTLPAVFGDHMVLQRHQPVPIWGTADPGALVVVRFADQIVHTTADPDTGAWRVTLASLDTDATPRPLSVEAHAADPENPKSRIQNRNFTDVLVGEVWLCSGQSNMEMALGVRAAGADPETTHDPQLARELPSLYLPSLRLLKVSQASRQEGDLRTTDSGWAQAQGEALAQFSAVGFFFGQRLQSELGVPVGLILSAWGGSCLEEWISDDAYAPLEPTLATFSDHTFERRSEFVGRDFDVMIAPLAPYALRGVIWYQGESNLLTYHDGPSYSPKFAALVADWRARWSAPTLPFYAVQIAPYVYTQRPKGSFTVTDLPRLWQGQAMAAETVPHTALAPIGDTVAPAELGNIHPGGKRTVGQRLAALALNRTYGRTQVPATGPTLDHVTFTTRGAIVHFRGAPGGLRTTDGQPPAHFELAGADGQFVPATATIDGETVVLASSDISAPTTVRYAWTETALPNLANTAGWPAYPFTTAGP